MCVYNYVSVIFTQPSTIAPIPLFMYSLSLFWSSPCQSDDPQQRDLVAETNLQDQIRITAAQTADNLAQRTRREDDANNMQEKVAAVLS